MSGALQRAWLGAVCLWLVLAAVTAQAADVPYLTGRIVDNAEILSPGTRESLEAKLAAHEQATTNQVVILTVPSLDGESIEGFATRVFDAWQLGQAGQDNGVLVIVAPHDRRMRIEVGYGLEGTLTDLQAARIIRDRMTPPFRDGSYDDGVTAGVDAIVATLEGRVAEEAPPAPAADQRTAAAFSTTSNSLHSRAICRPGRCASCSAHSSSASSGCSRSSACSRRGRGGFSTCS